MVELQEQIGEEEAELYDRQIRLWGLEAQNRLRNASVLLVGLSGLGAEVAKNLVLAGLKSIVLSDHLPVSEADAGSQFLAPTTSVGENRAEASVPRAAELNPLVSVTARTLPVATINQDYVKDFSLVVLIGQAESEVRRVDGLCRAAGVKFCAGDCRGWLAYSFSDFGTHEFADETVVKSSDDLAVETVEEDGSGEPSSKKARQDEETAIVKAVEEFPSFEAALDVDWGKKCNVGKARRLPPAYFAFRALWATEAGGSVEEAWAKVVSEAGVKPEALKTDLPTLTKCTSGELSPVCAIVGGVLAQEAIKCVGLRRVEAMSQKDRPLVNFFFYNGLHTTGIVAKLPPS